MRGDVAVPEDQATRTFEVRVGDVPLTAYRGQRLIELCDSQITPLQFGCRAGACGTCLLRVVEGMSNLTPLTENEEILLPALTDDPAARLGCQLQLLGPIRVEPTPPF